MNWRFGLIWTWILTFLFVGGQLVLGQEAGKQDLRACGGSAGKRLVVRSGDGCVLVSNRASPSWVTIDGVLTVQDNPFDKYEGNVKVFTLPDPDTSSKCQVLGNTSLAGDGQLKWSDALTYDASRSGHWLTWGQGKTGWVNAGNARPAWRMTSEGRYTTTKDFEYGFTLINDNLTGDWMFYSESTEELHAYIEGKMYLYKWNDNLSDFVYIGSFE